jgi:hypothetical protein
MTIAIHDWAGLRQALRLPTLTDDWPQQQATNPQIDCSLISASRAGGQAVSASFLGIERDDYMWTAVCGPLYVVLEA